VRAKKSWFRMFKQARLPCALETLTRILQDLQALADEIPETDGIAQQITALLEERRHPPALSALPVEVLSMIASYGTRSARLALVATSKHIGGVIATANLLWEPDLAATFPISAGLRSKLRAPVPPCRELLAHLAQAKHPPAEPAAKPAFEDIVFSFHFGSIEEKPYRPDVAGEWDPAEITQLLSERGLSTGGLEEDRAQRLQDVFDRAWYGTQAQTLVYRFEDGASAGGALEFQVPPSQSAPFARLVAEQIVRNGEYDEDGITEHACGLQVLLTDQRSGRMCAIDTTSHEMERDTRSNICGDYDDDYFLRNSGRVLPIDHDDYSDNQGGSMRWVIARMADQNNSFQSWTTHTCLLYTSVQETAVGSGTFTLSIKCHAIENFSCNGDGFINRSDKKLLHSGWEIGQSIEGKMNDRQGSVAQAFLDLCRFV
jgi:hypothetical protein